MSSLIEHEKFELEVLDQLNSKRLLDNLIFCGGTMLRLCHGLNRYSVDLDFWIVKPMNLDKLFKEIKNCLSETYTLMDATHKFYSLVFEFRSKEFPRSLKIEIRKETTKIETEQVIAYSKHSTKQVLLKAVSLSDMMKAKVKAFLSRKEIRDVFDMEFLFKKGIPLDESKETLEKLEKGIAFLSKNDYKVKLGSLLEEDQRKYFLSENFKLILSAIREKL